ncbi:MAG: hypothetical protein JOZ47_18920 [Kutzneria sp.]|nr:hypothetical protein [Kutzneria sp.]
MPTTRHRYTITETDQIAAALADAAVRWPQLRGRPGELLQRLIAEGHHRLKDAAESRRAAVEATAGAATGAYDKGYLDQLRADWPA